MSDSKETRYLFVLPSGENYQPDREALMSDLGFWVRWVSTMSQTISFNLPT